MKRILFWLIIGATVLMTLIFAGITAIVRRSGRRKENEKNERASGLMRDARYAMIK